MGVDKDFFFTSLQGSGYISLGSLQHKGLGFRVKG